MPGEMKKIQEDFDRIALLTQDGWNNNQYYHTFLLKQLPASCKMALDIGCGAGAFSRRLAERAGRVVALDLSPQMIEIAKAHSKQQSNIEYEMADIMHWPIPDAIFDCVASIATLHHLPMEEMLLKIKRALKVGGTLVILDLYESAGFQDKFWGMAAIPVSMTLRLGKTGRLRAPRQVREAWAEHSRHDTYPTLAKVRETCDKILPGAEVRRHLLWRYSIVWRDTEREPG